MDIRAQRSNPSMGVTTSYGGRHIGFRVVRTRVWGTRGTRRPERRRTIAELNGWLMKNSEAVEAHAKASGKRLIGREGL